MSVHGYTLRGYKSETEEVKAHTIYIYIYKGRRNAYELLCLWHEKTRTVPHISHSYIIFIFKKKKREKKNYVNIY